MSDDDRDILAALEEALRSRLTIVRIIIDEKGNELHRLYRSVRQPTPYPTKAEEKK